MYVYIIYILLVEIRIVCPIKTCSQLSTNSQCSGNGRTYLTHISQISLSLFLYLYSTYIDYIYYLYLYLILSIIEQISDIVYTRGEKRFPFRDAIEYYTFFFPFFILHEFFVTCIIHICCLACSDAQ